LILSRRPRDDDDEVEAAVDVLVYVRDRDSSKDRVWSTEFQLGFTSATGRHGATTELPEVERMHDRRHIVDDVTDGHDDVTLSGRSANKMMLLTATIIARIVMTSRLTISTLKTILFARY